MRKSLITFALIGLLAVPALADTTYTYSWFSNADYLGCQANGISAEMGTAYNRDAGAGGKGLLLTKTVFGGNAKAYLAAVWNLVPGDQVTVSVWRHDSSSAMPYFGLWSHYNDTLGNVADARSQNMEINDGTLIGDNMLGLQNGWEEYSHTWTIGAGHSGLIIDAIVSQSGSGGQIMVDDLSLTVPEHASVRLPHAIYSGGIVTPNEATSWTTIKNLFD